jgi:hypothetical protein
LTRSIVIIFTEVCAHQTFAGCAHAISGGAAAPPLSSAMNRPRRTTAFF